MARAISRAERWEFLMAQAINRPQRWEFLMAQAIARGKRFLSPGIFFHKAQRVGMGRTRP